MLISEQEMKLCTTCIILEFNKNLQSQKAGFNYS